MLPDDLSQPVRVRGYHGTTMAAARAIPRAGFHPSANTYDWLGDGIYFWQDAPRRAWAWARERFGEQAAVVGAEIRLADCLDLLDIGWEHALVQTYRALVGDARRRRTPLPRQTTGAHRLDNEIINRLSAAYERRLVPVRSVRAAFQEGRPIFPGSALFDRAHVQIAVRDPLVIEALWLVGEPGERTRLVRL